MEPITRKEMFLANAAGQNVATPAPITREEMFLAKIAENGGAGGVSSWNNLKDKPFGDLEELLPETAFQFDSSMGLFYTPGTIDFRYGETYVVNWNGVEYTTVAAVGKYVNAYNKLLVVFLGNPAVLGGTNNNLPFAIACMNGVIGAIPVDGSSAVTISILGTKKLDASCISNGACVISAEVFKDQTTWNLFLNMDTTELATAILNDRPIYIDFTISERNNGITIDSRYVRLFPLGVSGQNGVISAKLWILAMIQDGVPISHIPYITIHAFFEDKTITINTLQNDA